jgi:hypothetical protein
MANNKIKIKKTRDKQFVASGDSFTFGEYIDFEISNVDIVDGDIYLLQLKYGVDLVANSIIVGNRNIETISGTMDMSTNEMFALFNSLNLTGRETVKLTLSLWDETEKDLLLNDDVKVMNNPVYNTDPSSLNPTTMQLYPEQIIFTNDMIINMAGAGAKSPVYDEDNKVIQVNYEDINGATNHTKEVNYVDVTVDAKTYNMVGGTVETFTYDARTWVNTVVITYQPNSILLDTITPTLVIT